MEHQIFKSSDTNVSKFVFTGNDIAVEAVLYRYESYKERTVICCSTQCGCPVGCTFCGTGRMFVRNLTSQEILEQIETVLSTIDCKPSEIKKFQIMFMSMGEPFYNYEALKIAIIGLAHKYKNAQLLVSTSAPTVLDKYLNDFINLSITYPKIGLQFSVHESTDEKRTQLIPTKTSTLKEIAKYGEKWAAQVGRKPFYNYCVHPGNNSISDADRLVELFNPDIWETTLSVICEKTESVKASIERQLSLIAEFKDYLLNRGVSLRVFNPAGQDDIGGGCGQLWFFQKWRKEYKNN